jgi:hypothetical protein
LRELYASGPSCAATGNPRPFASNNLGRNSLSGFHRRLAPLAKPDNLIQDALRHFPLRGLGDLDDLVVGNDRHFIAVRVETDTFAGDVVDHDSIEVFGREFLTGVLEDVLGLRSETNNNLRLFAERNLLENVGCRFEF